LSALSFCKATGRINFSQAHLKHALSTPREVVTTYSFDEIEADVFGTAKNAAGESQSKNEFFVPFRITPNIEQFIGQIGIQGLFAGVITSASLAVSAQKQKNQVLLELLLSEEHQQEKKQTR